MLGEELPTPTMHELILSDANGELDAFWNLIKRRTTFGSQWLVTLGTFFVWPPTPPPSIYASVINLIMPEGGGGGSAPNSDFYFPGTKLEEHF